MISPPLMEGSMKVLTLKILKQDRERFLEIIEEEKRILEKAQSAILRIDGVLIYINKNIKVLEDSQVAEARAAEIKKQEEESDDPSVPSAEDVLSAKEA